MKIRYKIMFSALCFTAGLFGLNKLNDNNNLTVYAKDITVEEPSEPSIDNTITDDGEDKDFTKDEDIDVNPVVPVIFKNNDAIEYYKNQKTAEQLDDLEAFYADKGIILDRDCYAKNQGGNLGSCLILTQDYYTSTIKDSFDSFWEEISNPSSIFQTIKYIFNGLRENGIIDSNGNLNPSIEEGLYSFGKDLEDVIQNNMKDPSLNGSDNSQEEQLPDDKTENDANADNNTTDEEPKA